MELLGKGFCLWQNAIPALAFLHTVFTLSFSAERTRMTRAAKEALLAISKESPAMVIHTISAQLMHSTQIRDRENALLLISSLIKRNQGGFYSALASVVDTVIRSLDPTISNVREQLFPLTTATLQLLVKNYPMIALDVVHQKLAVGTESGKIILYDLKTATRYHLLEGHKESISALGYTQNGRMMISFAMKEAQVRIWQTGHRFLSMSSRGKCVRTINVPPPVKCKIDTEKKEKKKKEIECVFIVVDNIEG